MDFSGRILLSYLEEDNIQRAYFRVRPLLTQDGAVTQAEIDTLPDEGYLRVVPDKNEQHSFKDRMRELGMITVVCADSTVEAKAVACMGADIVLAEPTDLIGTGQVADDSYTTETVKALHEVAPDVLVMIASGVSTAEDCYNVVRLGADGTGATSGILKAPSPAQRVREMAEAIVRAGKERGIF